MKFPLEEHFPYALPTPIVPAVFYGIYFGNLLTLGFSVFAMVMLHLQILQEERYLESTFGTVYISYKKQVFRYIGRRAF